MFDAEIPELSKITEFRGQKRLKSRLMVHAKAALADERMLDDILLSGPAGTGKTTLARLLAELVRDPFYVFMMPVNPREFVRFCRKWTGGVLLLDELHSAPPRFQEFLYTAVGQKNKRLHPSDGPPVSVDHITFIGATTEPSKLLKPLSGRFKIKPEWEDYSDEEMALIVSDAARRVGVPLDKGLVRGLSRATGNNPRMAGTLVAACRDLHTTGARLTLHAVLELVGVDADGLSEQHLNYLRCLDTLNGTSGLRNIANMMRLSQPQVEELEPFLIRRGMITLEPTGRCLTNVAYQKLPGQDVPGIRQRRSAS